MNDPPALAPLAIRGAVGGVLMGLANLVPGISGGTMLLAAGVYPRFISAIGEVTTLKFRKASLVVLGAVVLAAAAAVVGLAGPVKELVVHQRWIMYSLFIGLTLGGVPVVWRLIKAANGKREDAKASEGNTSWRRTSGGGGVWIGAVVGFIGMAALAYVQMQGAAGTDREGFLFMLLAGIAGASAMILPGVSGGYLLLVLGVYVPILAAISGFKDAARAGERDAVLSIGLSVILPVGLGVILGIVVVSNILKWLLQHCERPTLGVLLGLLLGAVVGLFPFQQAVRPVPGGTLDRQVLVLDADGLVCLKNAGDPQPVILKGQRLLLGPGGEPVFKDTGKPVEPDDYPTNFFEPSAMQLAGALGLILGGFAATMLIDRFGAERKPKPPASGSDLA